MFEYELYRRSTLGECLTDALDELIQSSQITPQLAMKVLMQFDRTMADVLNEGVRSKATIKGHLHTYRHCDEVWTFLLDSPTIKLHDGSGDVLTTERLKIVACNARKTAE